MQHANCISSWLHSNCNDEFFCKWLNLFYFQITVERIQNYCEMSVTFCFRLQVSWKFNYNYKTYAINNWPGEFFTWFIFFTAPGCRTEFDSDNDVRWEIGWEIGLLWHLEFMLSFCWGLVISEEIETDPFPRCIILNSTKTIQK